MKNLTRRQALVVEKQQLTFKESLIPTLRKVSTRLHYALTDISNIRLDKSGISFTAGGYCMGWWFEENLDISWEGFDALSD